MEPAAEVNVAEIAELFQQDLILVETPNSSDEGTAALMAEVDGFPVLVAFTSTDHVRQFASSMPDMLDAEGELTTFVVSGSDFLSKLPDEFGVLANPETDDSESFPSQPCCADQAILERSNSAAGTEFWARPGRKTGERRRSGSRAWRFLTHAAFAPRNGCRYPTLSGKFGRLPKLPLG